MKGRGGRNEERGRREGKGEREGRGRAHGCGESVPTPAREKIVGKRGDEGGGHNQTYYAHTDLL